MSRACSSLPRLTPAAPAVALAFLCAATAPAGARTQQATVTGIVVEASESSSIGGATVRLSGSPPFFTVMDGAFRFSRVAPGAHTLTVEAMGYRTRSLNLVIRGDTALTIEMEPDPIQLDSLVVEGGYVTIRGTVLDATTGQRVLLAQVTVSPGFPAVGAVSGEFAVHRVPKGEAVSVLVEAIEYLPARIALITEEDTTLSVELEPDPVGRQLIAQQVEKLEARSNAVPFLKDVIGRKDWAVAPNWSVYDFLRARLGGSATIGCLVIDEVAMNGLASLGPPGRRGDPGPAAFLQGLFAPEVERIEIYQRGGMVRVYTRRFVQAMLRGKRKLKPIVYGLGMCR